MLFASSCTCSTATDASPGRQRPDQTRKIRAAFERDMVRRFRKLKKIVQEAVTKTDILGLRPNSDRVMAGVFASAYAGGDVNASAAAFDVWLRGVIDKEILDQAERGSGWVRRYVVRAFALGLKTSQDLVKRRVVGDAPFSLGLTDTPERRAARSARAAEIAGRSYTSLEKVTRVMSEQIRDVLSQGLLDGDGPMEIARDLADRVEKIGVTRARLIARTETISAHAEGQLDQFEEARIEGVNVLAEFSTAGDEQVCDECEALEGREYTIDEVRGLIPVHPNCRCTFIPSVGDP